MKAKEINTKKLFADIPSGMVKFLIKAVILFIVWRLLYEGYLKPLGSPDNELIQFLLSCTYYLMLPFYKGLSMSGYTLYINREPIITFAKGCNGLELIILYISFLICYPTSLKRFLYFSIFGLVVINVLNIFRCAGLAIWYYHKLPYWDFMHHYLFKIVIYAANFYLWVLYCRGNANKNSKN